MPSPDLSTIFLTVTSGLMLWTASVLLKITGNVAALQAHRKDHDNRIKRIEDSQ